LTEDDSTVIEAIEIPQEFKGETIYGVILRRDKYLTKLLQGLLQLIGVEVTGPESATA
jgi:hypothetical protein